MILLKIIVSNPWFRWAALAALVQQLLVASGTYLMGDIAAHIPSQGLNLERCLLLFLCMSLSGSVVFYAMNLLSLRSQHSALGRFFDTYFRTTFGNPLFWRNEQERSKRHDMMCREAQDAVQEGNSFLLDVWTTAWNILLNTASVVLIIGLQSGASILAAGIVSSLLVHFASAKLADSARDEMDDQNKLNSHLVKGWDNLVLGNVLSANVWKSIFSDLFLKANGSAERSLNQRERVLAVGNFVTSGTVVGSVLLQAWFHQKNIEVLIGLFAMLPRTMQIVMHLQVVQSYWAGWQRTRERLNLASECINSFANQDSEALMKKEQIRVYSHTHARSIDLSRLLAADSLVSQGRFTVSGANGAGKSVLLALLKHKFAEDAFYLPAHHVLELPGVLPTMSHGERVVAAFKALVSGPQKVLLLDEWDANLDSENTLRLDERIQALARNYLVVEVRHNSSAVNVSQGYAHALG